jgi:hypothetical protein
MLLLLLWCRFIHKHKRDDDIDDDDDDDDNVDVNIYAKKQELFGVR